MGEVNPAIIIAAIVLAGFLLLHILISVITRLNWFLEELQYTNIEINRASFRERKYWIRRRRRLWFRFLFFLK